ARSRSWKFRTGTGRSGDRIREPARSAYQSGRRGVSGRPSREVPQPSPAKGTCAGSGGYRRAPVRLSWRATRQRTEAQPGAGRHYDKVTGLLDISLSIATPTVHWNVRISSCAVAQELDLLSRILICLARVDNM